MTRCSHCHRPMKTASESGMGRVCLRKYGKTAPDLFSTAGERVRAHVELLAEDALAAMRSEFAAARGRLGVWA